MNQTNMKAITKMQAIVIIGILVVAAIAGAIYYFTSLVPAPAGRVIKIGAPLCLTGALAKEGSRMKRGSDLWMDYVNEKGGIMVGGVPHKVEVIYYDDKSDPTTSAKLTEKLITEDKVDFILGPYASACVFAASAISEKYGVIMVEGSGSSEPIFERGFKYLFATITPASRHMSAILLLANTFTARPRTVAILAENTLYPTTAAEGGMKTAKELGMEVVAYEKYPAGIKDFSPIITKWIEIKPDIVLGAFFLSAGIMFMRQAKELNLNPKIFETFMLVDDFIKGLGKDAEYVFGSCHFTRDLTYKCPVFGSAQDYVKLYKEKYGEPADDFAGMAVGPLIALQVAIQNAGSIETEKVREALTKLDLKETTIGLIKFNERGQTFKDIFVTQVQHGEAKLIWPEATAVAKPWYPTPPWDQRP